MAKKMYVGCPVVSATNLLGGQGEVSITGNANAVETYQNLSISPSLVQNHIYYFGVDISQDDLTAGAEFYWPIAEPKVMSETRASAINTWTRIGGVNSRTAWSSGAYTCRIDNNNHNTSATIKYKNFILIDLTATFGSGSEPDVTWCNENIGYFSGTGVVPDVTGRASPTARKVKKIYVGVNGIARKVKKAYVGVAGVARLFFNSSGLSYYGTATDLSVARSNLAATTVGNYGLFGGGCTTNLVTNSDVVDAYNTSLTRTTATNLSLERYDIAATTVGNYALFGGGYTNSSDGNNNVDAYNASLTKTGVATLSFSTYEASATTVGNYALLGGGRVKKNVNAYDTSLTRTVVASLSAARYGIGATTVGSYALFGGGLALRVYYTTVEVYNTSLTKTTATDLSVGRCYTTATTVGNYALFGGGQTNTDNLSVVDAYNTSLTRTTATDLSVARRRLAATTVGNCGLFGGGSPSPEVMDAYDTSLTRTTETDLSVARYTLAATTVGNYALFGGGRHRIENTLTTEPIDTVDVYSYTAS